MTNILQFPNRQENRIVVRKVLSSLTNTVDATTDELFQLMANLVQEMDKKEFQAAKLRGRND